MKEPIPAHLLSAFQLVERAYPGGVPDADYLPLLYALHEHFSIRNLAILAAHWGTDAVAPYNDVLRAMAEKPAVDAVLDKLEGAGFAQWLAESGASSAT